MKKTKGRRNFDPSADRRYTTMVCHIMASEKTRTTEAAVRATTCGLPSCRSRPAQGQPSRAFTSRLSTA